MTGVLPAQFLGTWTNFIEILHNITQRYAIYINQSINQSISTNHLHKM